ncbi:MAG: flagellar motor switch phosphatase FliY [Peptococcaceae bacterium]|nr:flagellar motor switch phosphatase FliY [Peptococcaceae bacterium]
MSNSILSQEEINALMNSTKDNAVEALTPVGELTPVELDALGEVSNIAMGSAATALSTLLSRKIEIAAPTVEVVNLEDISKKGISDTFVAVVDFVSGFTGSNVLLLSQKDGAIIIDLLMGGDGTNPPMDFNEIHISGIAEVMNQMMGSSATSLSTMLDREVNISPPKVSFDWQNVLNDAFPEGNGQAVYISFKLKVEGLVDSSLNQLITMDVAREMIDSQLGVVRNSLAGAGKTATATHQAPIAQASQQQAVGSGSMYANPSSSALGKTAAGSVQVQPVQFTSFQPVVNTSVDGNNLGLILDVPIQLSVELGRAQKTIKEILDFSPGSIVELDKLAGESVDLIANGKFLARGEVVVINENFGIRINEIINSFGMKMPN